MRIMRPHGRLRDKPERRPAWRDDLHLLLTGLDFRDNQAQCAIKFHRRGHFSHDNTDGVRNDGHAQTPFCNGSRIGRDKGWGSIQ